MFTATTGGFLSRFIVATVIGPNGARVANLAPRFNFFLRVFFSRITSQLFIFASAALSTLVVLRVFFALYDVMRMCGEAKKTKTDVVPRDLALALSRHLELFTAAYTKNEVKPKHHYAMHLPNQIANDGFLLDCFVHERKHQVAKTAATNVKNPLHFERSVYLRMVNAQTRSMPTTFDSHLTSKAEPLPQLGGMVALGAVFHGARVSENDVVFVEGACVLVKGCADLGAGGMAILGEACVFVEQVTAFAARWRIIRRRGGAIIVRVRVERVTHELRHLCTPFEGPELEGALPAREREA